MYLIAFFVFWYCLYYRIFLSHYFYNNGYVKGDICLNTGVHLIPETRVNNIEFRALYSAINRKFLFILNLIVDTFIIIQNRCKCMKIR